MIDVHEITREVLLAATSKMPEALGNMAFPVALVATEMAFMPLQMIGLVS